jgi:hypothetical protein
MKTIVLALIASFSLLLLTQAYLEFYVLREGLEGDCNLSDYRAQLDELRKKQDETDRELREMKAKQEQGQKDVDAAMAPDLDESDAEKINTME